MDDIVRQAMAKWPNVPHCYGWLGLDARGDWYMRDDPTQARGGFASGIPGAKGSRLQHQKLIEFIQRNYDSDAQGQWFFQNGPQRVYVELESGPWVWRVSPDGSVAAHDGRPTQVKEAIVDEYGWLYLATDIGFGLVHTQDMTHAADRVQLGAWWPQEMQRGTLATRFGYVASPAALHAAA